jgi:hypothetical protein
MIKNKWQLGILAVLAALVIAVFLRDAVEMTIIRPAAYILWWLGIIYRFIPQPALWFLVVLAMLYLTLESIAGKFEMPLRKREERKITLGPVAELASQIERKSGGIYFKWQIARTLGDIAVDLQSLHQPERRRKLDFDKNSASMDVYHYLDAGINKSFSDYPLDRGYLFFKKLPLPEWLPVPERFSSLPLTPFDIDIDPVISYLESQMENDDDFKRS